MSLVIWVIILCYVIFFVFMKWTTIGRRIYAVGSNPSAAEVSGINVKNIKLLVYTIMGLLAGLGGALQVSIYLLQCLICSRAVRWTLSQPALSVV